MTAAAEPGIRAVAALETGVHAIAREQATALVRDRSRTLVWIDVTNPGDAEAAYLRDALAFHPLAVEDCVRGRQRPKLDRYPDYFFLVAYAAGINPERERMALNEVHVFFGAHFLVTVHDHRVDLISELIARWRAAPRHFDDVGTLAHALLDALVDDYFPVLELYAGKTEELESAVLGRRPASVVRQILVLRHELVLLRRVVAPLRDVLATLLRRDLPFLEPVMMPYFQDVHDHTLRVTEEIDSLRELLAGALEAHRSESSNELNQTVRTLTAWSIILMSMTLVAGVYGMNFAHMPELGWRWGYLAALALMAVVGAALAAFFRQRRWL